MNTRKGAFMVILRILALTLGLISCTQLTIRERLLQDMKGQPKETAESLYDVCDMANEGIADWNIARGRGAPPHVIEDTAHTARAFAEVYQKRSLENRFDAGAREMFRFFDTCSQKFQRPKDSEPRNNKRQELA